MTLFNQLHTQRDDILASAKKHGIANVLVFGSVARGEERDDSDIDLLIELELPITKTFGFLDFKREVETITHRHVDILFKSGLYHYVRDAILAEARPL
jgi:uncharacterized protein